MRRTLYHFYLWAADRINDAGPLMMHEWSRPGGHYRLSLAPFPSSPGRLTVEGAGGRWGSVQETFMWENKPGPWFGGDPKQEALFAEIYLWNLLLVLYEGLLIFVLLDLKHVSKRESPREYFFFGNNIMSVWALSKNFNSFWENSSPSLAVYLALYVWYI